MTDTFECFSCHGTFPTENTEEEAVADYENRFDRPVDAEPVASVCEECFVKFFGAAV